MRFFALAKLTETKICCVSEKTKVKCELKKETKNCIFTCRRSQGQVYNSLFSREGGAGGEGDVISN